ncbi:MAG: DUF4381 domain-containing protein [Deltaproteobacteria bacterium]|jgi:hypothetical protein|nr:DUF4381 domain-containing protein [Deltaproteobacteria bacterium]MBW2498856.1 DUF4381 domain-containing protein [Deltaproteobacteria bacterium]
MSPTSLENLHDIVVPPAVSWWPLAPGWVALAAAAGLLALWGLLRFWRGRQRNRYRALALSELASIRAEEPDAEILASRLLGLLKRTALMAYPRAEVAALSGKAWWQYLDDRDVEARFAPGPGSTLERLAYRSGRGRESTPDEIEMIVTAVAGWIRGHRPLDRRKGGEEELRSNDEPGERTPRAVGGAH